PDAVVPAPGPETKARGLTQSKALAWRCRHEQSTTPGVLARTSQESVMTVTMKNELPVFLSAADVARMLGVSRSTVWRWVAESEGQRPDTIRLSQVTTRWLLSDTQAHVSMTNRRV